MIKLKWVQLDKEEIDQVCDSAGVCGEKKNNNMAL